MFTSGHFIWLTVIAAVIGALLVAAHKSKLPAPRVQRVTAVVLVALKLFHLSLSMKESVHGGLVIDQTQLSFHLCSIMIYAVILSCFMKNERLLARLKSFMVPCLMIGALMALLIPTEGVDPTVPRVWQYMLIHGTLVFYGLYLALIERVDLSLRAYGNNLLLLGGVTMVAFLMNSVLEQYGTNFLFLRIPPMENLPILNLNYGWYVYFVTLMAVACLLVLLVHLPFILAEARRKRRDRETRP
jgi:hypothetical integral membrane protein (TIGR02206 family)